MSSRYFRFNFYILLILAALNLGFNVLYIRVFDLYIEGAALATLTAVSIYNIAKLLLIWSKFKMHPFQPAMLQALGVAAGIFVLFTLVPVPLPPLAAILVRSVVITVLYGGAVYGLGLSPQGNTLVRGLWERLKR